MYKIVVDKKMPTTCEECGLYRFEEDDYSPWSSTVCIITDKMICLGKSDYKEILPSWCTIENVIPKERKKMSKEEKERIAKKEWNVYQEISNSWFGNSKY